MVFNIMAYIREPTERQESKGRFSVDIFYHFATPIRKARQMCDKRYYNTEQEKDLYIKQSIDTHRKFAQAYNTQIIGLKVDKKFWNINRLNEQLS